MNGEPVLEAHTLTIGRRASGILDKQIGTAARVAPNVYRRERVGQLYKREGSARPALVSGTQGDLLDPFKNAAGTSLSVMIAGSLISVLAPFCFAMP
jgi:hypothetical protein